GDEISSPFEVTSGILQGDTLAPFLFIIIIDYILKTIPKMEGFTTYENDINGNKVTISDLAFADDLVLIDSSMNAARTHLVNVGKQAKLFGLNINNKKSKILTNITGAENFR